MSSSENLAKYFFDIASWQRLEILLYLNKKRSTPSDLAKFLNSTNQEVHRNFERLKKSNFILKNAEGLYQLTTLGQIVLAQTKPLLLMSKNSQYFSNHGFEKIPQQFIQRIGSLESGKHIKGFVKVQEKWLSIYKNSKKFLHSILFDVPYTEEILNTISEKLENNAKIKSLFSESALIPEQRKSLLKNPKFKAILSNKNFERKMSNNITTVVVLNEKEASVCFPFSSGQVDVSQMFYGHSPEFVKWCLDYFDETWGTSHTFSEAKLKEY